jgi:hypothetical protein
MFKKGIYLFFLFLFLSSCGDTFGSVKRGLSGEKQTNIDEFLVEKKDPLILPPDFEELPIPGLKSSEEIEELEEDLSVFKNMVKTEKNLSKPNSTEQSILNKIKTK